MSHTTAIKGIKIVDIHALEAAIAELNEKGIKCSLVADATPRAYFDNQEGLGKADYVIKLEDSRYDIGMYKQEDGHYETRTDFWGGDVAKVLGGVATKPENREQAMMGRLFQSYGVHATMRQARMQGKSCQRVEDKETGKVQLILTGY